MQIEKYAVSIKRLSICERVLPPPPAPELKCQTCGRGSGGRARGGGRRGARGQRTLLLITISRVDARTSRGASGQPAAPYNEESLIIFCTVPIVINKNTAPTNIIVTAASNKTASVFAVIKLIRSYGFISICQMRRQLN